MTSDRPGDPKGDGKETTSSMMAVPDDWDALLDGESEGPVEVLSLPEEVAAEPEVPVATRHLGFELGSELYAMSILTLSEVVPFREITPVPRVRSFILGVISVRGNIIPVVDLAQRLSASTSDQQDSEEGTSLPEPPPAPASERERRRILIARHQGEAMGLLVDAISESFVLEPEEIELPPPSLPKRLLEYVEGIGRVKGRMHTILDVGAVLRFEAVAPRFRGEETS